MSALSFRVEIHHIGTLIAFERFETEFDTLFSGGQSNPFDPGFSGNKVALFSNPALAQAAKAVLGNGISTFADLGIGGALHRGGHKAFNNFQINAIDLILDNPQLTEAQQKAALWDLHRFSSDLAKDGSVPTADGNGSTPLAYPAGTVDQATHEQELTAAWEARRGPLTELTTNSALVDARNEYQTAFDTSITDPDHISNDADTSNVEARRDLAIDLVTAAKNLVGQPDWVVDRYSDVLNTLTNPDFNTSSGSADSKKASGAITSALLDITKAMGLRDSNGTVRSPLDPNFLVSNQGNLVDTASVQNLFATKLVEFGANTDGTVSLDAAQLGIRNVFNGLENVFGNSDFNVREFFSSTTNLVGLGGGFVGDAAEFLDASYDSIKKGLQTGDWSDFSADVAQFGVGLVVSAVLITTTTALAASVSPLLGALVGAAWATKGIYDGWVAISSLIGRVTDDFFTDGGPFADLFGPGGAFEGQFSTIESLVNLDQLVAHLQNLLDTNNLVQELANIFIAAAAIDPLTIDLDGDGVNTISVDNSNAFFDLDNDGVAERVGWIEPEDGFVVHDWNGDGVINNRSEQFAKFEELARHDANGDGIVSAADLAETVSEDLDGDDILDEVTVGFDSLRIWIDANSDGVTDAGELRTLSEQGITSIDLNATNIQQGNNGNELNAQSSVTFSDGSTQDIFGISFNRDATDTDFQARIDALDFSANYLASRVDAFVLPRLAGAGDVPSLLVAALENDDVLSNLRASSQSQVNETAEFMQRVQQLVVDWAGAGDIDPGSRPGFDNAQHLAAMEAFVGVDFDESNVGSARAVLLQEGWDAFVTGVALRIAVQSEQSFNPGGLISHDPVTDTFSGNLSGFLDNLTELMQNDASTSRFDNEGLLQMVQSLQLSLGDSSNEALFEAFFEQALTINPNPVSTNFFANSAYYDVTQNFSLDDDYQHPSAVAAVIPNGNGATVILTDVDTDFHDFEAGDDGDEVFDLTLHDAGAHLSAVTEFSDNASDDGHLYYGFGDDYYAGFEGSDTYIVNKSVGFDTIDESGAGRLIAEDVDRLMIQEGDDDAILSRDGFDLFISWVSSTNVVRVIDQFYYDNVIEGLSFNGSLINGEVTDFSFAHDAAWIEANAWYRGDEARNALNGTTGNETFHGAGGDDVIEVGTGNDTIVYDSGDGNDVISAGGVSGDSTTLRLRDLSATNVFLFIREYDLFIEDKTTGHIITVEDHFYTGGLTSIEFSGGETWDQAAIENRAWVVGTEFRDDLLSSDRSDTYWGREGDDALRGGNGGDTYLYAKGDGNDYIDEASVNIATDVLKFTDLNLADIRMTREAGSEYDLYITIIETNEVITVRGQFQGHPVTAGVERIEFADGSFLEQADFASHLTLLGTDASEILYGSASGEDIIGGLGDDQLNGHDGGDTYIYSSGDGSDLINEQSLNSSIDILRFTDLNLADVLLTQESGSGYDLFITILATGDVITINDQLQGGVSHNGVERIEFADGTILDRTEFASHLSIAGTDQNDVLDGSFSGESFLGGLGDDTLNGEAGGDTYIYASGDGNDFISDDDSANSSIDVLRLTDLNTVDIVAQRVGSDFFVVDKSTGERIEVDGQFSSSIFNYGIDEIHFADGTVWDRSQIEAEAILTGDDNDNSLSGTSRDEIFYGGLGNDSLYGTTGSDTYIYASGDGSDFIDEQDPSTVSVDVLRLTDINASDVQVSREGSDVFITILATGDRIELDAQLYSTTKHWGLEEIHFADGEIWDRARIRAEAVFRGDDSANSLSGTSGEDVFNGGLGNDSLYGAAGSDTYIYASGDGSDFIDEQDPSTVSVDVLRLTDINASDVQVSREGSDVFITILATGDRFELDAQLYSTTKHWGIEEIHFADGEIWDRARIRAEAVFRGDDSANSLSGTSGEDVFNGGLGNDSLYGAAGSDTYIYASGDGSDFLDEQDPSTVSVDILRLTDINASGVEGSRIGTDFFLTILATGDRIELDAQFYSTTNHWGIEEIHFADGEIWDRQRMRQEGITHGDNGANTLHGTGGNDVFNGGLGADVLYGNGGSDTYVYASGDGSDFIDDENASTTDVDVLRLTDINAADVQGSKSGADFFLTILATGDQIRVDDQFYSTTDKWGLEEIHFADGEIWDRARIRDEGIIRGDDGNNSLYGTGGDDIYHGGLGNDNLYGAGGADTYIYASGDGNDWLDEEGPSTSETDVLKLTDLNQDDIYLTKSGDDLMVNIIATGEHIEVDQHYWNTTDHYGIEEIHFADGTVWDRVAFEDRLNDNYLAGTAGADTLDGGVGNDSLLGEGGADSLIGGDGNDRLTGGLGDDILQGDAGSDTFVFAASETGSDQILDFTAGATSDDVIEFDSATFANFAEVYAAATDDGTDTTIVVDANHSIVLNGVLTGQLHDDDFTFV